MSSLYAVYTWDGHPNRLLSPLTHENSLKEGTSCITWCDDVRSSAWYIAQKLTFWTFCTFPQRWALHTSKVEDDELSNTMFTVPFWKDGASWFITRMNKERDSLSLSSSIWSLVCNTKGALLVLPGSMWSINIKHLQSSARKPPLRSRILNSALFHNHLLQFSYSGCPYIAIFNPYWFIFRLNN